MGLKVLVVDDDEIAGGLSRDLLAEAGMEADLLTDSLQVIETLRNNRYPLVVLDILMPGIDGLSLCHKIKSDPGLRSIKVVMVSGKSFEADKKRAREYGADLFIEKPYSVETFAQQIAEVAGRSAAPPPPPAETLRSTELASTPAAALRATVWGCRSLPGLKSSGPSRYGHKTSCVSVEAGDHRLIFDAGTGLAALGEILAREGRRREHWFFLTHFHRDHVEGLAGFWGARQAGHSLHISGAGEPDKDLQQLVQEAFEVSGGLEEVQAEVQLYPVLEESYEVFPDILVSSFYANHPGTTLGYVLETKGRKLVYCPDSELYGESATALQDYDERLGRICSGADLLIHDGRYTSEDYRTLRNNGHSSFKSAVDFAGRHGIKRLVLFHHDSQYSDADLDRLAGEAARLVSEKSYPLQVGLAREGLTLGI